MQARDERDPDVVHGSRESARGGRRVPVLVATLVLSGALAGAALAASTDFTQPATSPETAGDAPVSVVAADLDGDGDRDLATADFISGTSTILRNNGAGNFAAPASSPELTGDDSSQVAAADLDGDTDQDLAVANQGTDDVTILRNSGTGNFTEAVSSPESAGDVPLGVVAADLDGDADRDLAVANQGTDDVTILRNNGSGNFTEPATSPETAGDVPLNLVAADLDGDGDQDLAVPNAVSEDLTILRNNGSGNFVEPPSSPEPINDVPFEPVAADLDGDTDQDLAVPIGQSDVMTILRNNGSANFTESSSSPEPAGDGPISVAAADFDGDGDRDLAAANFAGNGVTILRNNGVGNFAVPTSSPEPAGTAPADVAAADLDGDGDPDLAVANQDSDNVTILRNR